MTNVNSFAHRRNSDTSFDSICLTCFQTIASADSVDKLIVYEEYHSCDPNSEIMLAQLRSQRSTYQQASDGRSW